MSLRPIATRGVAPGLLLGVAFVWIAVSAYRATSQDFASDVRPLDRIPPGTRISDRAPKGFSHLIFKSHQELAAGDVEEIPEFAFARANFLFTAMAARVGNRREDGRQFYGLDSVAIGLGTQVGKHDMVISYASQKGLGANLGPLRKIILSKAEALLGKVILVSRSDATMFVDAPTLMLRGGKHRTVILRYVFLVDRDNGQLATVILPIDVDASGTYQPTRRPAVQVQPNLVRTSPLHVDGKEVVLGFPSAKAFAAVRLPPGKSFDLPTSLIRIVAQQHLTAEMAEQIDAELRRVVFPRRK